VVAVSLESIEDRVDPQRHTHVLQRLLAQLDHARTWEKTYVGFFHDIAREGSKSGPGSASSHTEMTWDT